MSKINELEIYAPIDGFTDYLVTSHGRVFSLKYGKLKELKQVKNKNGYLSVVLCKNSKSYRKWVHRLVAQAFIPNTDNKPQVNHINEIKVDNRVENLEWMTAKENLNHGTHNERIRKTNSDGRMKGKNNPMYGKKHTEESKQKIILNRRNYNGDNNPRAKSIIGFKINGCNIKYYKYINESIKDGFIPSHISKCCKNEKYHNSHKGYKWYYADEFFNKNK